MFFTTREEILGLVLVTMTAFNVGHVRATPADRDGDLEEAETRMDEAMDAARAKGATDAEIATAMLRGLAEGEA